MNAPFNVLIVEDDPIWQKQLPRYLQDEPLTIKLASNYQAALDLIEADHFDLVILDVNLTNVEGNIDGLLLGEKIWCQNRQIKIIIVSGSQGAFESLDAQSFTFNPYYRIWKASFDLAEFIVKIRQALAYSEPHE